MLHHLIMGFAALTRFTRKWLIRLSLVIFLIGMNIATLVSNTVYDAMSRMVWGMVEIVSDRMAERRPKNRAEMDAEISRSRAQADAAKAEADAAKSQAARSTSSLDEANARNRSMATELEMAKADASTARGEGV